MGKMMVDLGNKDLEASKRRIRSAFDLEEQRVPPVLAVTRAYWTFGERNVPDDYYTSHESMLRRQIEGHKLHFRELDNDYVPYVMPWYGTGVLASAFGCKIRFGESAAADPAVVERCVQTPDDVKRLKLPDPERDGLMPLALETIDYFKESCDLPVGLTDMQGPLDTAALMCGHENLYSWMYTHPDAVHALFDIVTEAFIEWVKVQKRHIGDSLERTAGALNVWTPEGVGVWLSDDDVVLLSPGFYEEFVVPYNSRIMKAFGGGVLHYCGDATHNLDNLGRIEGLRALNVFPMGNFESVRRLQEKLGDKLCIQICDFVPMNVEEYYESMFEKLATLRGLMLAPVVSGAIALSEGAYVPVDRDEISYGKRVLDAIRRNAEKWHARQRGEERAGEGVSRPADAGLSGGRVAAPVPASAVGPTPTTTAHGADISAGDTVSTPGVPEQKQILSRIQQLLVGFRQEQLAEAVREALDRGVPSFEIIKAMADAMNEVGARYESGQFFLPELVMAGTTMKKGVEALKARVGAKEDIKGRQGNVVIGTVKGDLHDIGKNIVGMMFQAAGFEVYDIGVDQPPSRFVEEAQRVGARVVGMSALLTTTINEMKNVIKALEDAGIRNKVLIMVGGAPVTQAFAEAIGADGYAPDAVRAVAVARQLIGRRN